MAITFGSMTMSGSIPRALKTMDPALNMVQKLNSTWNTGEAGPTGAGQGAPTITADVAAAYSSIRNMQQDKDGGLNKDGGLIHRVASWFVGRQIDEALKA